MVYLIITQNKVIIDDYFLKKEIEKSAYDEIIIKKIGTLDKDLLYFDLLKSTNIELYISGKISSLKLGHEDILGNWGALSPSKVGIVIESENYCRYLGIEEVNGDYIRICKNPMVKILSEDGVKCLKCDYAEDFFRNDEWKECERAKFIKSN